MSGQMSKEYKAQWHRDHYVPHSRLSRSVNPCSTEGCEGTYAWSKRQLCHACQRRFDHNFHRERFRRNCNDWSRNNRPMRNAIQNRRRAMGGSFTAEAWEALIALFGHLCAYCRQRFEKLEHDHIIPLSKGGLHIAGNLVPACRSCNAAKGNR